ncbi:uncharacterized protein V1518DRAFT_247857 [Limtongia smithiae]|uniref:uncharacterized protein n=1 Tax=Limtongia smithiae TaxID=1125753 RepID=UPI0034CDF780
MGFCFPADVILVLIAIVFPPLPVWIKRGICSADSLINIALCTLGFIPGLLHSWYIIARFPEEPFIDPSDIEAQDFARRRRAGGAPGAGPQQTAYYTRQEFVYTPYSDTPAAPASASPSPAPAVAAATPLVPAAATAEIIPPPYEEIEGQGSSSSSPAPAPAKDVKAAPPSN